MFLECREAAYHGLISVDLLFLVETYSMDLPSSSLGMRAGSGGVAGGGLGGGGRGNSLYRWECTFWIYVVAAHLVVVLMLGSPVDVFDYAVTVAFQILCIMFLCRPRQSDNSDFDSAANSMSSAHLFVLSILLLVAANSFASIPHVYEADRLWALAILVVLDILLLVVHLYDHVPTMYTIVMGRLIYVVGMEGLLVAVFYCFKHRLDKYAMEEAHMV